MIGRLSRIKLTVGAGVLALSAASSVAQMGIPSSIPGAPFTAAQTRETLQADGTVTVVTGTIARRWDGSIYFELRNADGGGMTVADNYATRVGLQCYLGRGICTDIDLTSQTQLQARPADYVEGYFKNWAQFGPTNAQGTMVETFLGRETLQGVDVAHTSVKMTDGRTSDRWYAPALDMYLRMNSVDPRSGVTSNIRIEQLKLGEPDPELFEMPTGYRKVKMIRGRIQEPTR